SAGQPAQAPVASPAPAATAATSGPAVPMATAVRDAVAAVPDGRLGLAVYDRRTGRTVARHDATAPFPAESVVKLLIGLDALDHGEDGAEIAEMLSRSDDAVASTLWDRYGRTQVVTRMAGRLGLTGTRPPQLPYMWGDTAVTAEDIVRVYRYILTTAPVAERDVVLTALRGATRYGADGFDQYFGIPQAVGDRPWAVKQGWACCQPYRALNTTGLLGADDRYILVALTTRPAATGWDDARRQVTSVVTRLVPALFAG
ncbi:MAG: hypothetical protein WCA46_21790, partial [Actinocatenispora sp.]